MTPPLNLKCTLTYCKTKLVKKEQALEFLLNGQLNLVIDLFIQKQTNKKKKTEKKINETSYQSSGSCNIGLDLLRLYNKRLMIQMK